ncbi:hypothetical protein [Alienimonas californiensis]|uniref:Uncharacterized protein n=1 Tax=Alienimonas californiensis TaxID=2527989 RepID=A0A517P4R9_9PLAN|nr:hypothetical protein [Alienimonas californiensis]QDT14351.1 hypothetical protein CA12_04240 [Alienimonas californiensis]
MTRRRTRPNRLRLAAVVGGVSLLLLGITFLVRGVTLGGDMHFGWFQDPRAPYDYDPNFTMFVGPLEFVGEWAWIVPTAAGLGGTLGGVALLIWTWRAKGDSSARPRRQAGKGAPASE